MCQKRAIFLTGSPSVGKSTAIQRIIKLLDYPIGGFYTQELRERDLRVGFEVITLTGKIGILARKSGKQIFDREAQLGEYRVNLDTVDSIAVPALEEANSAQSLVVIDEIAPMELFSTLFCDTVMRILANPNSRILGTIVERSIPFADQVKSLEQVQLEYVTLANRDGIPDYIVSQMNKYQKGS